MFNRIFEPFAAVREGRDAREEDAVESLAASVLPLEVMVKGKDGHGKEGQGAWVKDTGSCHNYPS